MPKGSWVTPEINLADEQIEDLVDDAIRFIRTDTWMVSKRCTKYKVDEDFLNTIRARGDNQVIGITTMYYDG